MKIFVSHSIKDKEYLNNLQNMIKDYDLVLLIGKNGPPDHYGPILVDQVNALLF